MSEFSKKLKNEYANEYANEYGNEYDMKNKGVANGT